MKKNFTLKGFLLRKEGWMSILVLTTLIFFGCYEFFSIKQPTAAYSSSSFKVPIVVKPDSDASNDWTLMPSINYGIFGVLVPDGWVVKDSISYKVASTDSALNTSGTGLWVKADKNHSNQGYFIHSAGYSDSLTVKQGVPSGYHWWGALSADKIDMAFFDSCSFEIEILTDTMVGTFYLQYTLGDEDYAGRRPVAVVSDVLQIDISKKPSSVDDLFARNVFSAYPNPTNGLVHLDLNRYKNQVIDLEVFNINGRMVLSTKLNSAKSTIDLSSYPKGTYFLKLNQGSNCKSLKILLQ